MKIKKLKKMMPRMGFVLAFVFFGIATLEVIRTKNWIAVGYWGLIALMFLLLDGGKRPADYNKGISKGF